MGKWAAQCWLSGPSSIQYERDDWIKLNRIEPTFEFSLNISYRGISHAEIAAFYKREFGGQTRVELLGKKQVAQLPESWERGQKRRKRLERQVLLIIRMANFYWAIICQTLHWALYLDLSQLLLIATISASTLQVRKWRFQRSWDTFPRSQSITAQFVGPLPCSLSWGVW